jgi:polyferredoxin
MLGCQSLSFFFVGLVFRVFFHTSSFARFSCSPVTPFFLLSLFFFLPRSAECGIKKGKGKGRTTRKKRKERKEKRKKKRNEQSKRERERERGSLVKQKKKEREERKI